MLCTLGETSSSTTIVCSYGVVLKSAGILTGLVLVVSTVSIILCSTTFGAGKSTNSTGAWSVDVVVLSVVLVVLILVVVGCVCVY